MKYVEEHIEKLLFRHGFLTIPGLGGLVAQTKSAQTKQSIHGYNLFPPCCEVSFNQSIHYNDGLLLESYMQNYKLNATDADAKLRSDINLLHKRLNRGELVTIGTIGTFEKDATGSISFRSLESNILNSQFYGLRPINTKHIGLINNSNQENPDDNISLSFSKRKLYRFGTAVASIVFLVGVMVPIRMDKMNVKEASIASSIENIATGKTDNNSYSTPALDPIVEEAPAVSSEKQTKKEIGIGKTYYIVVAGGISKAEAEKRAESLCEEGYINSGVVSRDEKDRVFIDHFNNREDAEASLEVYRTEKGFPAAWLLILK